MGFIDTGPASVRAVEDAIRQAWPEVAEAVPPNTEPGGIWEESEAEHVAYENLVFPRAHIQWMVAEPWPDGPMTAVTYEQPVLVYYLAATDSGATESFRSKLKGLQDQLLTGGLVDPVTGQEFTVLPARFRTDLTANPAQAYTMNTILIIRNQYALGAGLAFCYVVGDDAS